MLYIANSLQELDFNALMQIYDSKEPINENVTIPEIGENTLLWSRKNDLYSYLKEDFFTRPNSFYGIWAEGDQYISTLRMEPYEDGFLLQALKTHSGYLNKGFATKLFESILTEKKLIQKVYSHVEKRNIASMQLHRKLGFQIIKDYAKFLDGSVSANAVTFMYEK